MSWCHIEQRSSQRYISTILERHSLKMWNMPDSLHEIVEIDALFGQPLDWALIFHRKSQKFGIQWHDLICEIRMILSPVTEELVSKMTSKFQARPLLVSHGQIPIIWTTWDTVVSSRSALDSTSSVAWQSESTRKSCEPMIAHWIDHVGVNTRWLVQVSYPASHLHNHKHICREADQLPQEYVGC